MTETAELEAQRLKMIEDQMREFHAAFVARHGEGVEPDHWMVSMARHVAATNAWIVYPSPAPEEVS
jgi:hypothetical protein